MFGYIVANKPEMKIKEYETYKSVYCALCKKMGKDYGVLSRLTLSYDFTFAALLGMAVKDSQGSFEKKRCVCNPLKKCIYCTSDVDVLEFCGAAAMVLSDYKIRDNIKDSSFFKSLCYRIVSPIFKGWRKKAVKNFPQLKTVIADYEKGQTYAEKHNSSLDAAAEPTALALKSIFSNLSPNDKYRPVFAKIGYCVGKWVYLVDAGCDLEEDLKTDSFNPLSVEFKESGEDKPFEFAEKRLTPILNCCLNECADCYELLDIYKFKPILDNIIYSGMPKAFKNHKREENI